MFNSRMHPQTQFGDEDNDLCFKSHRDKVQIPAYSPKCPIAVSFKSHRDKVQIDVIYILTLLFICFKSHRDKVQIATKSLFFGLFFLFERNYYTFI